MHVKIEPSGCCERKGMVQIRLDLFLDKGDYRYEEFHIQVPDIPEGETFPKFSGDIGKAQEPTDEYKSWLKAYYEWADKFPKKWVDNSFWGHMIQVEPAATDQNIIDMIKAVAQEAFIKWNQDLDLGDKAVEIQNYTIFPHNVPRGIEDVALVYQKATGALPISFLAKIGKTAIEYLDRKAACETRVQSAKAITVEVKV